MRTCVLALVTEAFGGMGGIARYNQDICRALASSGDAEVIVLPRSCGATEEPIPDRVTQYSALGNRLIYAFGASLRSRPPVHVVFCGHLYVVPLAYLLARRFRAKLWLHVHGIEVWQEPSVLRRWAAERADLVTAVSRCTRRRLLNWARLAPERVRVVPATYQERFTPGPKSDELLERYGLREKRVLLTVGRLASGERYKGQDRVLGLLPAVRQVFPDVAYVVAGDGDDRARLAALARELHVEDLAHFIGSVPPGELPDLYRTADLFVMPSTGEGFGIAFLEAAASGLKVIGGSRDGSVDALRDGAIGTLVDPDNREQLRGAILAALRDEAPDPASLSVFERRNFEDQVRSVLTALREPENETSTIMTSSTIARADI